MVRGFAFSIAALVLMGVLGACASAPPPPPESAPVATPETAPPPPETPPESPVTPEGEVSASASEAEPGSTTEQPAVPETSEVVAEPPKAECAKVSDCKAKGKPEKGSKWACASGMCEQVRTAGGKKAK